MHFIFLSKNAGLSSGVRDYCIKIQFFNLKLELAFMFIRSEPGILNLHKLKGYLRREFNAAKSFTPLFHYDLLIEFKRHMLH